MLSTFFFSSWVLEATSDKANCPGSHSNIWVQSLYLTQHRVKREVARDGFVGGHLVKHRKDVARRKPEGQKGKPRVCCHKGSGRREKKED